MVRIRRWVLGQRKKVVWSEPKLPPYVKFNPNAVAPGPEARMEPGDLSMGMAAHEFLAMDDEAADEDQDDAI
jgi:hypothetical protein